MSTRIEQWFITYIEDDYTAPELREPRLAGNAYGHPNPYVRDGEHVETSRIVAKLNGCVVTRSGTVYELGEVLPDYELQFPNAKQRLMDSISSTPKWLIKTN